MESYCPRFKCKKKRTIENKKITTKTNYSDVLRQIKWYVQYTLSVISWN